MINKYYNKIIITRLKCNGEIIKEPQREHASRNGRPWIGCPNLTLPRACIQRVCHGEVFHWEQRDFAEPYYNADDVRSRVVWYS